MDTGVRPSAPYAGSVNTHAPEDIVDAESVMHARAERRMQSVVERRDFRVFRRTPTTTSIYSNSSSRACPSALSFSTYFAASTTYFLQGARRKTQCTPREMAAGLGWLLPEHTPSGGSPAAEFTCPTYGITCYCLCSPHSNMDNICPCSIICAITYALHTIKLKRDSRTLTGTCVR